LLGRRVVPGLRLVGLRAGLAVSLGRILARAVAAGIGVIPAVVAALRVGSEAQATEVIAEAVGELLEVGHAGGGLEGVRKDSESENSDDSDCSNGEVTLGFPIA
jgi:hypothetical protein